MISVSHAHARRLIQTQLDDRKLPEEQWAALHVHLETCAECRDYQARLSMAERGLRRALRQRWEPFDDRLEAVAPALSALFRERKAIRRMGSWMLGASAAFLLCVVWFVSWSAGVFGSGSAAPAPTDTPVPLTPTPSYTPTPIHTPSDYRGVIVYEYRPENGATGRNDPAGSEIYLLNTGTEPVNLTNDPADDRAPAWSPDGEWVAFFSNRTGKDEVFVMHISGTRLTQLTNLPEVIWRGPISWSSDGQMLALLGDRGIGEIGSTWVYLAPLDGTNAYPLGHSQGAIMAAFSPSPNHRMLAFSSSDDWDGRLVIYNFDSKRENFLPVDSGASYRQLGKSTVNLFEWSPDGKHLLFRADTTGLRTSSGGTVDRAELRGVTVSDDVAVDNFSSRRIASVAPTGSFSSFSWTGINDEIAYLVGADEPAAETGCKNIRLGVVDSGKVNQPEMSGLCVEGDLERANWRMAKKSILVVGHTPGGSTRGDANSERGLYVMRFYNGETRVEWLADARGMVGSPHLRVVTAPLTIDPQPVYPAVSLPPSRLPGPEVGDLLVTSKLNDRTLIARLAPGSNQRMAINQSVGENSCPVWSPDRARIAFLSDRSSEQAHVNQVFVMDGSGLNVRQLTQQRFPYRVVNGSGMVVPYFGCPIWSADGRWLAALVTTPQVYVAVIPVDEKDAALRYLSPIPDMDATAVVWLPDGRLLVAYSSPTGIRLRVYHPDTLQKSQDPDGVELLRSDNWSSVYAMAASPDSKSVALAVNQYEQNASSTYGLLTTALGRPIPGQPNGLADIPGIRYSNEIPGIIDSLHWLPDGRLGYTLRYPAGRRVKAEVFTIVPDGSGVPERIAAYTDTLLASAWSDDGHWLTAITEAGRFVLETSRTTDIAPTWIDAETGSELDW